MRTSLYLSLCSVMVLSLSIHRIETNYCSITNADVSQAFIVEVGQHEHHIYFGDGLSFWRMNVENFQISDKKDFKDLFGNIKFERVTSGVGFGAFLCDNQCNQQHVQRAQYLLLIIGTVGTPPQLRYGYMAYRVMTNIDPSVMDVDDTTLPWHLIPQGQLNGPYFFIQGVDAYEGFTFDETTKTIYMSTTTANKYSINFRSLDENEEFSANFTSIEADRSYTALIDWNGKIYGLADNKFYLLEFGTKVEEKKEFTAKQFFFCEGFSPLLDGRPNTTDSPSDLSSSINTGSGVTDSKVTGEGSENPSKDPETTKSREDENEPPGSSGPDPNEFPKTSPQTTESAAKSNWILWIVLILIIVVIIIAIILFLFCCKKSEEKEMSNKSKPDSKIVSEYDSGSIRTGATTVGKSKDTSKSDSAKGSSTGSKGGADMSTKSNFESVASVRSSKI